MKTKILMVVAGALILVTGCVGTVSGGKTAGVPFVKDSVEGRYKRSVDEVFIAAKAVVSSMGIVQSESILHETNLVKTVVGRVAERKVWVRIEGVDPEITAVAVQTRTSGGGSDLELAHQIEKQIAVKLVR